MTSQDIELMSHPPYGPDLTTFDFFITQALKIERRQQFSGLADWTDTFNKHVYWQNNKDISCANLSFFLIPT